MGVQLKQMVNNVSIYGVNKVESNIYYRPVNINIDTNLSICTFWIEGRRNNIHGDVESQEYYTIEIDKKKDLFEQIYTYIKSLPKYSNSLDV